jgi:hypothetical protein
MNQIGIQKVPKEVPEGTKRVGNDNQKVSKGLSENINGVIRGYQSSSRKVTDG